MISLTADAATLSDSASIHKLLTGMLVMVGVERSEQITAQQQAAPLQIEHTPTKRLVASPPAPPMPRPVGRAARGFQRESLPADLDNEIPF